MWEYNDMMAANAMRADEAEARWQRVCEALQIAPEDVGHGQISYVVLLIMERLLARIEALEYKADGICVGAGGALYAKD